MSDLLIMGILFGFNTATFYYGFFASKIFRSFPFVLDVLICAFKHKRTSRVRNREHFWGKDKFLTSVRSQRVIGEENDYSYVGNRWILGKVQSSFSMICHKIFVTNADSGSARISCLKKIGFTKLPRLSANVLIIICFVSGKQIFYFAHAVFFHYRVSKFLISYLI